MALAVTAGLVSLTARLTGWEAGPLVLAVAVLPWAVVALAVATVLAASARRWLFAGAAALACAVGVWTQAPLATEDTSGGLDRNLITVATLNLTYGAADTEAVVALVHDYGVDVLAVEELTPEAVAALRAAGLEDELPFSALRPVSGYQGTGLWSRTPFDEVRPVEGLVSQAVAASANLHGKDVTLVAAHPMAPGLRSHGLWSSDLERLRQELADIDGTVVVAGDFNATRDHAPFRAIEAMGFVDAADQAGAGLLPTFPEGLVPYPLIAIDHVLVRDPGWVAVGVETVTIPGADHRALVATYAAAP